MIPFDFEYYRPDTVDEAVEAFQRLDAEGKQPLYYAGGTEIITMARVSNIFTGAVVDIKGIPECNTLEMQDDRLVAGAAVTLSRISESGLFPMLGAACSRIADHTVQCKITLGGNIAGTIIYREAVLPILLCDASLVIAGPGGLRTAPAGQVFNERLRLARAEFVVKVLIDSEYAMLPYVHFKKTRLEKIDYPLLTLVAVKKDDRVRVSFSGLCGFPFRSTEVEDCLNAVGLPVETRIENAVNHLPAPVLSDLHGSAAYRLFVLKNTLLDAMSRLDCGALETASTPKEGQ